MTWNEIQDYTMCITPTEWNTMVAVIEALVTVSCPSDSEVTFTMWEDCSEETGQSFKFDLLGTLSTMEGGADSGDDLIIKANTADTYPFIKLFGNAEIYLEVANDEEILFKEGGNQFFLFDHGGTDSVLGGGASSGDGLTIKANTTDTYPFIFLWGNNSIYLDVANEEEIFFREGGNIFFKFDRSGADSKLYGGANTTNDLLIYPNSTDLCPLIHLEGDDDATIKIPFDSDFYVSTCSDEELLKVNSAGIWYKGDAIRTTECSTRGDLPFTLYNDCATVDEQGFLFSISGAVSTLVGSDDTGDYLKLKANSNDGFPIITLQGAGYIHLDVGSEKEIKFLENTNQFFYFDSSGITSLLYGGNDTGDALKILANSTDSYPYISLEGDDYVEIRTTNDIYFYEQAERMFKFELSGISSTMYGGADSGDDLLIYPNSIDDCSLIKLFGNAGITNQIKYGSAFEISTCSDEILFEVAASSPTMHINFHCLEAYEFRLENRQSNPSGPTCQGRLWFRTDLA